MVARIPILDVSPVVDRGRFPVKAVVGETFTIEATVFREGHDVVGAGVVLTDQTGSERALVQMTPVGVETPDRYRADVTPDAQGAWTFRVESWGDPYATWRHAAEIKIDAGVDVELMLLEGASVLERAAQRLPATAGSARNLLSAAKSAADASRPVAVRLSALTSADVVAALGTWPCETSSRLKGRFRFTSTAPARCTAPGMSSSRARRAPS